MIKIVYSEYLDLPRKLKILIDVTILNVMIGCACKMFWIVNLSPLNTVIIHEHTFFTPQIYTPHVALFIRVILVISPHQPTLFHPLLSENTISFPIPSPSP